MNQDNRLKGHIASATAYTIFGLNIVFCKDIANASVVPPAALLGIRMCFAAAAFWLTGLFTPKEKVERKDMGKIFIAAMIGLLLTQYSFLIAITMASSIDASIVSALGPVMTMIIAAIFIKEPISGKKAAGVGLSLVGVLTLIFTSLAIGKGKAVGGSEPMGLFLLFVNILSFSTYLGVFRPLIRKYSVVTFMKWMFLFCAIVSLPISLPSFLSIDTAALDLKLVGEISYLVILATYVSYFLIPIGQQNLRPTLVSMYNYVQPVIAVVISIISGIDTLTWEKVIAIIFVFGGVAIVNSSKGAEDKTATP